MTFTQWVVSSAHDQTYVRGQELSGLSPDNASKRLTTRLSVFRLSSCLLIFYSNLYLIISLGMLCRCKVLVCANKALAIPALHCALSLMTHLLSLLCCNNSSVVWASLKLTDATLKPLAISVLGFTLSCVANTRTFWISYNLLSVYMMSWGPR
jgi:hypothetical protein